MIFKFSWPFENLHLITVEFCSINLVALFWWCHVGVLVYFDVQFSHFFHFLWHLIGKYWLKSKQNNQKHKQVITKTKPSSTLSLQPRSRNYGTLSSCSTTPTQNHELSTRPEILKTSLLCRWSEEENPRWTRVDTGKRQRLARTTLLPSCVMDWKIFNCTQETKILCWCRDTTGLSLTASKLYYNPGQSSRTSV